MDQLVEYAAALHLVMRRHPEFTLVDLSAKIGKPVSWIAKHMSLNNLCKRAKPLVNEGKIPATTAFLLAKLPKQKQVGLLAKARKMTVSEFYREYGRATSDRRPR